MTRTNPFFIDIETGGIDPSQSSILSIAFGDKERAATTYIRPQAGTFLSSFSEQKIIPQLLGKDLVTEKSAIESLIFQLQKNPATPLSGFNIRGFDTGFIQRRAREYGMEQVWIKTLKTREIQDPIFQIKDIIAGSISKNADEGVFKEALGGLSWDQAEARYDHLHYSKRPIEYNLIAQVKGYQKASRESAIFKGWKLEDIYKIMQDHGVVGGVQGAAHEAASDVKMTAELIDSVRSGKFQANMNLPSAATQWMSIVKERGYKPFGEGRLLSQSDVDQWAPNLLSRTVSKFTANRRNLLTGVGIAAAAIAAYTFSGRDDHYNTIEGLGHGGMAQQGRLHLTEFGSGWKGILSRTLKTAFVGMKAQVLEMSHLMRHNFVPGLKKGKPMEVGLAGFTALEAMNTILPAIGGYMTPGVIAGATAGFIASKYTYLGYVKSRQIGNAGLLAVQNPEMARKAVKVSLAQLTRESIDYMYRGKQNLMGTFVEAGGGEAGKLALLHRARGIREPHPGVTAWSMKGGRISGRDDIYNKIEGLLHGGVAQAMRKERTPFGSGWDALRNLVKAGETFEKMIGRKSFKQALSQAETVQVFGEGGMGTATMMKATYRGQEFNFIRKTGQIGEHEGAMMKQFQDKFAPTLYGQGEIGGAKYLDMEMFQGGEFKDMAAAGKLTPEHVTKYESALREMHKKGLVHGDAHARNAFVTPEGNVGLIDFGLSGRMGESFADDQIIKPGGAVGRVLAGRKMGEAADVGRGVEYGFYRSREVELDAVAIEVTRELQKKSAAKAAQLQIASAPTQKTAMVDAPPTIHGIIPDTMAEKHWRSMKKVAIADVNRSAAATVWGHGKNGGRRSRT